MLPLKIEPDSNRSLTSQIVSGIEELIAKGILTEGSRLPSCDQLAREIGTHRLTVLAAYKELRRKKRVASIPRRGTTVIQSSFILRREIFHQLTVELWKRGRDLGFSPQEIAEAILQLPQESKEPSIKPSVFVKGWDLFAPMTIH